MRVDVPRKRLLLAAEILLRGGEPFTAWMQTLTAEERDAIGGVVAAIKKASARAPDPGEGQPLRVEIASIVSAATKRGMVELTLNGREIQMDLDKAREVVGMLHGAIEAAVSDELLFKFLVQMGLAEAAAGRALLDFRELRQGSRETVSPS